MAEAAGRAFAIPKWTLIAEVRAGKRKSIARLMSLAESNGAMAKSALAELHRHTGRAHVIGLTGVPGSGKSTMVRALAQKFRGAAARSVSSRSIRPVRFPAAPFSAIASACLNCRAIPACTSAAWQRAGRSVGLPAPPSTSSTCSMSRGSTSFHRDGWGRTGRSRRRPGSAHRRRRLGARPRRRDQAIEAGVLEIADIHVVSAIVASPSKPSPICGRCSGSARSAETAMRPEGVPATSAQKHEGMDRLVEVIDSHRKHLAESGELVSRNRHSQMRILKAVEDIVRERLLRQNRDRLDRLIDSALGSRTRSLHRRPPPAAPLRRHPDLA